jgi:hypothetical protein
MQKEQHPVSLQGRDEGASEEVTVRLDGPGNSVDQHGNSRGVLRRMPTIAKSKRRFTSFRYRAPIPLENNRICNPGEAIKASSHPSPSTNWRDHSDRQLPRFRRQEFGSIALNPYDRQFGRAERHSVFPFPS